jgi:hypothetical protein
VIRLTTITLRHFDAGERAPSTIPAADKMGGRILIYVKALFATPHDTNGLGC